MYLLFLAIVASSSCRNQSNYFFMLSQNLCNTYVNTICNYIISELILNPKIIFSAIKWENYSLKKKKIFKPSVSIKQYQPVKKNSKKLYMHYIRNCCLIMKKISSFWSYHIWVFFSHLYCSFQNRQGECLDFLSQMYRLIFKVILLQPVNVMHNIINTWLLRFHIYYIVLIHQIIKKYIYFYI